MTDQSASGSVEHLKSKVRHYLLQDYRYLVLTQKAMPPGDLRLNYMLGTRYASILRVSHEKLFSVLRGMK
jgi:thiaminase